MHLNTSTWAGAKSLETSNPGKPVVFWVSAGERERARGYNRQVSDLLSSIYLDALHFILVGYEHAVASKRWNGQLSFAEEVVESGDMWLDVDLVELLASKVSPWSLLDYCQTLLQVLRIHNDTFLRCFGLILQD
jgi:hypothetical protein